MTFQARYVQERKLASGKTAWYFLPPADVKEAKLIKPEGLGTNPGRAEARANYLNRVIEEWREKEQQGESNGRIIVNGTVDFLIDKFLRSKFVLMNLAINTQKEYKGMLWLGADTVIQGGRLGSFKMVDVKYRHADDFYTTLVEQRGINSAAVTCAVMRRCFTIGVRWEYIPSNPFSGLEIQQPKRREQVWTNEQLEQFYETCKAVGRDDIALAVRLAYATSARPSDILRWQKKHYNAALNELRFVQQKTGNEVAMPLEPEVAGWFTQLDHDEDYVVVNEQTMEPFNLTVFSKAFRRVMEVAGLPTNLQFRDIRRTVLTELGNAGCSADEMQAVSGHRSRKLLDVYVNKTMVQSNNAMNKRKAMKENV